MVVELNSPASGLTSTDLYWAEGDGSPKYVTVWITLMPGFSLSDPHWTGGLRDVVKCGHGGPFDDPGGIHAIAYAVNYARMYFDGLPDLSWVSAPRYAAPGQPVSFSVVPTDNAGALSVRFDLDGDSQFDTSWLDYDGISPVLASTTYGSEGTYQVLAEVRSVDGSNEQFWQSSTTVTVPEPTTVGILALGALSLIRRRHA